MSRVYGDQKAIARVEQARPGDNAVYINMDAINQLPEQYEAHISTVRFDPQTDFADVGNGNFMPNPNLYADIAIARGIEGTDQAKYEPIIEEVDINPLLMKPLEAEPTYRKMKVGYVATKVGFVLNEDGTPHYSDPCTASYNVFERCVIDWSKEEELTNGYDPEVVKNGKYRVQRGSKSWDAYVKYDTKFKRKRHFDEEMKFAQRKADTKARHVVIRVLAGLKTGYRAEEINEGAFYFAKIRRSQESLKLEQAAHLQAISQGVSPRSSQTALFGPPETEDADATFMPEAEPFEDPEPVAPSWDVLKVFKHYYDNKIVPDLEIQFKTRSQNVREQARKAIEHMEDAVDMLGVFDSSDASYDKTLRLLALIEDQIPEQARVDHGLF